MTVTFGLLAMVLLTVGTGYFVAQEFSYVAADRNRLQQQADAGDVASARALQVMQRLSFMLSGAQFGITVTALLVGFLAEPALGQALRPVMELVGVPRQAAYGAAVTVGFVLATVGQMIFGELAPKKSGIVRPEAIARALGRSTLMYLAVVGPVVRFFDGSANRLLRAVGIEPVEELRHGATVEELARIVDESGRQGFLSTELSLLLDRALEFKGRTAGHAMVPRPDVMLLHAGEPATRVVELAASAGHSRYPVVGRHVDDLVGVVTVRDVLELAPERRAATSVGRLAGRPLLVPESLPLPAVLEELRRGRRQFACVMDEYGGLAGVVTLEDVVEELVGEIADETDRESPGARAQVDGSWLVPGQWRLDEVERATGVRLPSGVYDTVGGLVIARLGRLPETGDQVVVEQRLGDEEAAERQPVRYRVVLTVEAVGRRVPTQVRVLVVRAE